MLAGWLLWRLFDGLLVGLQRLAPEPVEPGPHLDHDDTSPEDSGDAGDVRVLDDDWRPILDLTPGDVKLRVKGPGGAWEDATVRGLHLVTRAAGEAEILTNTVIIHFYPNSWEIFKKITKDQDGKTIEEDYDPKAKFVIDEIGKLAGQFGNARIIIEGHTDSSMKGNVPDAMVKELSLNRANSVKEEVIKKFKFDPNKFNVEGFGWDRPADASDPTNHAQNRRVEVKVFTAEQG